MLRQEARAAVQAVAEHRPRIDNGDRRIIHGDDGKETAVNPNPGRQSPAPRPHVDRILGAGPFSFLQNLARCQTAGPVFAQLLVAVLGPRHERQLVRSEEHTSELQSLMRISYAVFCLKKKNIQTSKTPTKN